LAMVTDQAAAAAVEQSIARHLIPCT